MTKYIRELTPERTSRAQLLIQFLSVAKDGLVRPYDQGPVLKKLEQFEKEGFDVSDLRKCCPPAGVVQDAKDFKPYILAALDQFAELLDLDVDGRD